MNRLIILFLFFIILSAKSSGYNSDILILKGDTLTLFSNPLVLHPRYNELSIIIHSLLVKEDRRLNPVKYESEEVEVFLCYAEWTVTEDKLYLSNIYADHDNRVKVDL